MCGCPFYSRSDFLKQKIQLYRILCNSKETTNILRKDYSIVETFLIEEIENFTKIIIEGTLALHLIDNEFLEEVYLFDKEMYEKIFTNSRKKVNERYDFETITKIALSFKDLCQSIGCLEWAYERLDKSVKNSYQHCELYKILVKIHFHKSYPEFEDNLKNKVLVMLENFNSLPSGKVIILNLGNGFHLNLEEKEKILSFHSKRTVFRMKCVHENEYEFEDDKGLVMCAIPPNSSGESGAIFTKKIKDSDSKWIINLCDPNNPSEGYLIKAKKSQAYLCSKKFASYHPYVSLEANIDDNMYYRFAWKIAFT